MRKILICGDFTSATIPQSRQLADGFESLGCCVERVDTEDWRFKWREKIKKYSKSLLKFFGLKNFTSRYFVARDLSKRSKRVSIVFDNFRPDLVVVVRGNSVDSRLISDMRMKGAVCCAWWIKDVRKPRNMLDEIELYDFYFCIHKNLSEKCVSYLPAWNFDGSIYKNSSDCGAEYEFDVVFVGIWNEKRERYIKELSGCKLCLVGPGWKTRTFLSDSNLGRYFYADSLFGDELINLYKRSKIVLNINQWEQDEATGTTLRVVDVPACGSFLLSEYSRGLEEIYQIGVEVEAFSTPHELRQKVDYYLLHQSERNLIAKSGYLKSISLPTAKDRAASILKRCFGE